MSSNSAKPGRLAETILRLFAIGFICLQISTLAEAGKLSNLCKGPWCYCPDDVDPLELSSLPPRPAPQPARPDIGQPQPVPMRPGLFGGKIYNPNDSDDGGIVCVNPNAPKRAGDWGIAKLDSFPTVEQIAQDLVLCGIANSDKIHAFFSSFGAKATDRTKFKNSDEGKALNLKNILDIMPLHFDAAAVKFGQLGVSTSMEQKLWTFRISQAFASVAVGDVYVITNQIKPDRYDEKLGPFTPANIYSVPYPNQDDAWMGRHNVWYTTEFYAAQQNPKVSAIYTVSNAKLDDPKAKHVDKTGEGVWIRTPLKGENAPYFLNANDITVDGLKKLKGDFIKLSKGEQTNIQSGKTSTPGLDYFKCSTKRSTDSSCALPGSKPAASSSKPTTLHTQISLMSKAASKSTSKSGAMSASVQSSASTAKTSAKSAVAATPTKKAAAKSKAAPTPAKTTAAAKKPASTPVEQKSAPKAGKNQH